MVAIWGKNKISTKNVKNHFSGKNKNILSIKMQFY